MVMRLLLQVAVSPAGKFVAAPIPVAPVVAIVITGESAVFIQMVRGVVTAAVLLAVTVIVPVALILPHPPVNGME